MPYIGVSPQFGVRRKHTYTATAGQTSFSGAGSEGATLSYKDSNFVDVYQNGVKLGDADYTSTSGTAIVLAQGASVDDLVEIIVFDAFSAADTVSKADGGTFDGNVTMGGTLDVTGALTGTTATLTTADNTAQLTLKSTDADSSFGPILQLARDSASPADGDAIGQIKFVADNDAGQATDYGTINGTLRDASDGTEDAQIQYNAMVGGSSTDFMRYGVGGDGEIGVIFNEGSIDSDFRVESDSNTHAFFVQGSDSTVGVNTSSPSASLHVRGADASDQLIVGNTTENTQFRVQTLQDDQVRLYARDGDTARDMIFYTGTGERMRIRSGGFVAINTTGGSAQFQVLASSGDIVYFQNTAGVGAKLTAGNQSFSAVSDENKKENIVELDKQQSYDNIKNIRAVTYKFKDMEVTDDNGKKTTHKDDKSRIGFIAQDWEPKYSQLVNTDDEGVKSLLYTETTPVLLSALQKAQEKIEALEARITALEKGE